MDEEGDNIDVLAQLKDSSVKKRPDMLAVMNADIVTLPCVHATGKLFPQCPA